MATRQRVRVLPVVYACSGCTSAGQLADHVARSLDREGTAEMGSIAGIGAADPQQLSKAKSRFPVIAIDGCANHCAARCLQSHGIEPAHRYVLADFGAGKRSRSGFAPEEAEAALQAIRADLG
jgi:uncharacterized metal-binding protein